MTSIDASTGLTLGLTLPCAGGGMLTLTLLEQLHLVGSGLHDELRLGGLLLGGLVLPEVHAADDAQNEQADRGSTDTDPAQKPIHEVSLRRGQGRGTAGCRRTYSDGWSCREHRDPCGPAPRSRSIS